MNIFMSVREVNVREDVKLNLPKGWKLEVYEVVSKSSQKKYWVQILWDAESTTIALCDCPEGKFLAPLEILGLQGFRCKHAQNLIEFLSRKGSYHENRSKG